jgi:LPXTG-motif cell wall-anchored protein
VRVVTLVAGLLFAAALAGSGAAATGFTVTITSGPGEGKHLTTSSVTFAFQASSPATYQCGLDNGALTGCDSGSVTYTQLPNGQHTFEVVATDSATSDVATAPRTFVVAVPPQARITSKPPDPSTSTDATFSFTSDQPGATFECALDGGGFASCTSPVTYRGLATDQTHVFAVHAVSATAGTGPVATFSWEVKTSTPTTPTTTTPPPPPPPPPAPVETTITGSPSNPTASRDATFYFTSNYKNATFQCSLNDGQSGGCTSPVTYSNLSAGTHTFKVVASSGQLVGKTPASFSWTIQPALQTTITKAPPNPSSDSTATFEFTANLDGATFECSLNGGAFEACASPKTYEKLPAGEHRFEVRARAGTVVDTSPARVTWTVSSSGSSNTWLWIVLGVGLLALLGVGGYYLYRRRHPPASPPGGAASSDPSLPEAEQPTTVMPVPPNEEES